MSPFRGKIYCHVDASVYEQLDQINTPTSPVNAENAAIKSQIDIDIGEH